MPEVRDFALIIMMRDDLKVYRAVVSATNYVEACRGIIHKQMAAGKPVLQITSGEPQH